MQNENPSCVSDNRLAFVKKFMAEHDITQKDLADLLGKSKCAVSHMFSVADDMRLSEIEKVFGTRGCSLKLLITKDPSEDVEKYALGTLDRITVGGDLVTPRLYFILVAMKRYGVNRETLAGMLGIKSSTIRYWIYIANDTYFSKIVDVAKVLGCHLKIRIVNSRQEEDSASLVSNPGPDESRLILESDNVKVSRL